MKKLKIIAETYCEENLGNMPAVIIQHATLPHKKFAKGFIKDLPLIAEQQHISHPALIIIGHVVDIDGTLNS